MITSIITATFLARSLAPTSSDLDKAADVSLMRIYDDKVYVVGQFERANRKLANNIAVWNGTEWSTLGRGVDGKVYDICKVGNDIYVAGDFTFVDKGANTEGIKANRIAKWDGTKWSAIAANAVDRTIYALATDGKNLYMGGNFTKINDETETRGVAKYDGTKITAIDGQFDRAILSMTWLNGKLYAGGIFNAYGDDQVNKVAVWDGTSWSEAGNGGLNASVSRLTNDGTSVYASGKFSIDGSQGIAKYDGSKWTSFAKTNGETFDISYYEGTFGIAGEFTKINGKDSHKLAVIKGSALLTTPEVLYAVHRCVVPFKGSFLVGGKFGDVQADPVGGVLKWGGKNNLDDYDVVSQ
jgi:trimeric autotransporter adhesin